MPSPFPGMDPFIESRRLWEDFHPKLINEIESAAATVVPDRYLVRLNERSYIVLASSEDVDPKQHRMQADVSIVERPDSTMSYAATTVAAKGASVATIEEEAVEMHALVEAEFRETFVEISQLRPERRLVTTIEVLSPSNKRRHTEGWELFNRKRQAHLEGRANLVEIDLLRRGQRMPMCDDWPESPYYILTCWKKTAPMCKVWPAYVDRPLPKLRIPLSPPDDDIVLDLQPMVDAIYERSRYAVDIDYEKPCHPALDEAAVQFLKARLAERK